MFRRRMRDGETRLPESRGPESRSFDGSQSAGPSGCEALDSTAPDAYGEPLPIATLIARAFGVTGHVLVGPPRPQGASVPETLPAGRRRHLRLVRAES